MPRTFARPFSLAFALALAACAPAGGGGGGDDGDRLDPELTSTLCDPAVPAVYDRASAPETPVVAEVLAEYADTSPCVQGVPRFDDGDGYVVDRSCEVDGYPLPWALAIHESAGVTAWSKLPGVEFTVGDEDRRQPLVTVSARHGVTRQCVQAVWVVDCADPREVAALRRSVDPRRGGDGLPFCHALAAAGG